MTFFSRSVHSGFGRAQRWTNTGIFWVIIRLQFGDFDLPVLSFDTAVCDRLLRMINDTAVLQPVMVSSVEPVMVSLSNHQTGADSGLLRASETGMTFFSRSVIPVLDKV